MVRKIKPRRAQRDTERCYFPFSPTLRLPCPLWFFEPNFENVKKSLEFWSVQREIPETQDFGLFEGRKCYEYFHDPDDACPWCKNPDVFAGNTVHWEWHSTKNQRTYDLVDTPLKNPDGSISKLEIFHDITERKAAQEALERKIEELRRFNEMAVDRELKTVELKKNINDPLQEMGKEPHYEIPE